MQKSPHDGAVVTIKADASALTISDDGYGDVLSNGDLFTGVAYEFDEVTGQLIGLAGYRYGKQHGPFRTWHPNGSLAEERYCADGGYHGPVREWHEDGSPKVHSYWQCSRQLWWDEWDERGNTVKSLRIRPGSESEQTIVARLSRGAWPVIDIDVETMEFFERPQGWGKDLPPEAEAK